MIPLVEFLKMFSWGGFAASAAAHFAIEIAPKPILHWFKFRRLAAAYSAAASATIEHCRSEGYPERSDIWNAAGGDINIPNG